MGWDTNTAIVLSAVNTRTFSLAHSIKEPGLGIFVSFWPAALGALNSDARQYDINTIDGSAR